MGSSCQSLDQAADLFRQGQIQAAIDHLRQLVRLRPGHLDALRRLGSLELIAGEPAHALVNLKAALELDPEHPRTLNNAGQAQLQLGSLPEAIDCFESAVRLSPDYALAHFNLGSALLASQRPLDALSCFTRALRIERNFAAAHAQAGRALLRLHRVAQALEHFERALALQPEHVDAWVGRAQALSDLERAPEALECCDRALALAADNALAHNTRGLLLTGLRDYRAALASFDAALAARPDDPDWHSNRGAVLRLLDRREEAIASYRAALALDPRHAQSHNNLGVVLQERHDLDSAILAYDRAIELHNDYGRAHLNRAYALLLKGDYARGWAEHERQYHDLAGKLEARTSHAAPVLPALEALEGRSILLHSEQGFGDTIQFCRYASLVGALGATVLLQVQPHLVDLLRSLDGIARVHAEGDPAPPCDHQCSLLRLPFLFQTTLSTIPARVPYLRPAPDKVAFWRDRLGERRRPRVGLAWSSGVRPNQAEGLRHRNIPLIELSAWKLPNIEFVSLQKGERAESELAQCIAGGWDGPAIVDHSARLRDFSDTAALIQNLDLVVTVDTAVAHLAGALAKPVWILNRFDTCWRWLLEGSHSPWYPSARLFRQVRPEDWAPVIAAVRGELAALP
jgi:tetratricopeptide (TPR) repeat protein